MLKKILILGVTVIMVFGSLSGCGGKKNQYNAVLYGNVYEVRTWLKDEFYDDHLTFGSFSNDLEDYIKDETYPQYRTKIIETKDEFDAVFEEFPIEVDFEKEMVLLHCFTTASSGEYEIKSISIDEQTLSIRYKPTVSKGKTPPNASKPLSKWVVVKMDKLDIKTAKFIFSK